MFLLQILKQKLKKKKTSKQTKQNNKIKKQPEDMLRKQEHIAFFQEIYLIWGAKD